MAVKRVNEIPISESNPLGGGSGVVEVIERVIVDEETKLEVEALNNMSTATMLALTDIYESKLETDTNVMLALAEVYELILGGM